MRLPNCSLFVFGCLLMTMAAHAQSAPLTPVFSEPSAPDLVLNPNDVHMETNPFSDPDPLDQHLASTWEIWTVAPVQRIWIADTVTGLEKLHAHLGDGTFENSHLGLTRLWADTQFTLRVRHRDDSGNAATEWSAWASIAFATGVAGVKNAMLLEDVDDVPAPRWVDAGGTAIDLPAGAPHSMLRLENDLGWLLLRIDGNAGPGNRITNPVALPLHRAVRVIIKSGNTGGNLVLPASVLSGFEQDCEPFAIYLPAINLAPNSTQAFWVSEHGATYDANATSVVPDFTNVARTVPIPWQASRPGYRVDVVAAGLSLPVNIAFVPNAGSLPSDPKFYVTELYGTIKVVTNAGNVRNYANGVINYSPSGAFPGSGEQGLTGIAVDPATGDVFAAHLWRNGSQNYPRITRYSSTNGGVTATSSQVILDMQGELQGQSHLISCLEIVNGELFCHMGDGFNYQTAQNLGSYRGKILRLNLNGTPIATNPFYSGGTITSRDYVYCYGVRNPFGGAWRAADGFRYCVENGPSVDRLSKLVAGRNFGWDNSNASMSNFALYNWAPSAGPVNIAFVQPQTFAGSGFPQDVQGHAFVTESGATYAPGEQAIGKMISEFVFDAAGNVTAGPLPFVEYTGDGFATMVGLAAGPDGLYFSELYSDSGPAGPTTSGGRILRIRYGDPSDCNENGLEDSCELAIGAPDFDGNGVLDVCDPLSASSNQASVAVIGQVDFSLRAGTAHAGQNYQLLGSMTGTNPGTQFGTVLLPLNSQNDPWFALTTTVFHSVILQNTIGTLDAAGEGQATLLVPPIASLLGLQFSHAYLVTDSQTQQPLFASNAMPLLMVL
ncbi:MAG: glucose/arabinose dehydrogenase [Planctomycetota bacterium]|jgi:glucose/arabinose dehydrogenase